VLLEFLQALNSGEKTPRDLLEICLRRIAASEPDLRAWVEVSPQAPLADGLLNGIPFGVKDIFETRGLATEYGSPLYAGRKGASDAHVVSGLRRTGAVLLGKTRTTAFASFDPAATRNPRFPGHTPGGSSSGSAAAVAAGMVPFALGTQTLGSVLRPASFCGICGFKPSFGLLSCEGVLPFAPSLDTVGLFTTTAAGMAELWSRGFGGRCDAALLRAGLLRAPDGLQTLLQLGRGPLAGNERIAPAADRDAPVRHRATRIGRRGRAVRLNRGTKLERVHEGDGSIELRLRVGAAGGGEVHRPELLAGHPRVLMFLRRSRHRGRQRERYRDDTEPSNSHDSSLNDAPRDVTRTVHPGIWRRIPGTSTP